MQTVIFKEVGRRNDSWSAQTNEITYDFMFGQVKKHGVMSSDIDFINGRIYAGFHCIGTYEIKEG